MQKKKIQVFVSSTFADMREERQAAVEAILTAGHIPAGMELFAAGDQSQMQVIRRWIEESDVFLLVLGGRYGSIEPSSGKSYIHLEYEYAIERDKPLFAIVIDPLQLEQKVRTMGTLAVETEAPQQLKAFAALVKSRMVRFWRDPRDIKLAVLETLSDYSRREDVVGWVRGDELVSAASLAEEIARLAKENTELRARLAAGQDALNTYNGLTFDELYGLLLRVDVPAKFARKWEVELKEVAEVFGDSVPGLVHAFWIVSLHFAFEQQWSVGDAELPVGSRLTERGLTTFVHENMSYALTDLGRRFLLRLEIERNLAAARPKIYRE